jgi:hypothetical protein
VLLSVQDDTPSQFSATACGRRLSAWSAQVRVATYNIQFLSIDVVNQGDRLSKLPEVIALLDAHVIGLQEVADRSATELLSPLTDWHLVIDDDCTDLQDLALAVRKPLRSVGLAPDLDADDEHFLAFGMTGDRIMNGHAQTTQTTRRLRLIAGGFPGRDPLRGKL